MREAESTRRSSLEYRIASLESDNALMRRFHGTEMEKLKNEVDQFQRDRDQLLHSLKENEKAKDSLLRVATSELREKNKCDLIME
jgi:hypothetical protein